MPEDSVSRFRADLRAPSIVPPRAGNTWSEWSKEYLITMRCWAAYRFVKGALPAGPSLSLLEIGSGNGYLTLELARDGHKVIGLEPDGDSIELAHYTAATANQCETFGTLRYDNVTLDAWQGDGAIDAVIFNRTLHHLPRLEAVLLKVRELLRPGGLLICNEFAFNNFDDEAAAWLVYFARCLRAARVFDDSDIGSDPIEPAGSLRGRWTTLWAAEGLHGYEDMLTAMRSYFREISLSSDPYLFVRLANGKFFVNDADERAIVTVLKECESHYLKSSLLKPISFRFVGYRP